MLEYGLAIIETIGILTAAFGLSGGVLKSQHIDRWIDFVVFRILLGLGIISYLTFVAAAIKSLNLIFFIFILVMGNCMFILDRSSLKRPSFKIPFGALGYLLIPFVLVNLFYALFPPTFYDSMYYHLSVPAYYIQNGGFVPWETNFNSNLLLNVEMIFTFALLGKSVLVPKLLMFFTGIGVCTHLYSFARKYIPAQYAIVSSLIFYAIPQVGFISSTAKPDLLGMFFMLAGIHLYGYYRQDQQNKRFLGCSALLWGVGVGSKYTFAFFLIPFLLAIFLFEKVKVSEKFKVAMIISLIVFVCVLPWFAKNVVFMGNPVYPYLSDIFENESWSEEQRQGFSQELSNNKTGFLDTLWFPIDIFLKPYKYGMIEVFGPLFLAFLPFVFFSGSFPSRRNLVFTALLGLILLLFLVRVPRYYVPVFMLLSIPIAVGVHRVTEKRGFIKKMILPLSIFLVSINLIQLGELQERYSLGFKYIKHKWLVSSMDKNLNYLYVLPYYPAAEYINTNLKESNRILLLGEERTFYFKIPLLASTHFDRHPLMEWVRGDVSPGNYSFRLKKMGVSHLLYYPQGLKLMGKKSSIYKLDSDKFEKLSNYLASLREIYRDPFFILYQVK